MGNSASYELDSIKKKYGEPAVDYIIYKNNQRMAYRQTRDELQRIVEHANLQERQDIEWCHQEKRMLSQAFEDFKSAAQLNKPGSIKETQAKHNKTIDQISGYDDEYKKLEAIQRQVRSGYRIQKERIKAKVDQQIQNATNLSSLNSIPEFDKKTDGQRKAIEDQCLKQYPGKKSQVNTVEIERSLRWDNHKASFDAILNKNKLERENAEGRNRVKGIVPRTEQKVLDGTNVYQPSSFCC